MFLTIITPVQGLVSNEDDRTVPLESIESEYIEFEEVYEVSSGVKEDHEHDVDLSDREELDQKFEEELEEDSKEDELDLKDFEKDSEEVVLIPDDRLRYAINNSLGADYIKTYNPTLEDLQSLKSLKILDPFNSMGYVYITDFTGLELLTSLEEIEVAKTFVSPDFFDIVGGLPSLKIFEFINSYTAGNAMEVGLNGALVNDSIMARVPFNPEMNLGALGKSNTLESIYITTSYVEVLPNFQYRARGHLILEGLENLETLKTLNFGVFSEVDDKNMEFLKGLKNLETLRIFEVPFEDATRVNDLENAEEIHIDWMNVKDYSEIINPAIDNTVFHHSTLVVGPEGYEKTEQGFEAHYNTGIKIPETATNITVEITGGADLDRYELIDGVLFLNVTSPEFNEIFLYNPMTNERDLYYKGFEFSLSYTLASGIIVDYSNVIAEVSDLITFKLKIVEDDSQNTEAIIKVRIEDFDDTKVPTLNDFGLSNYEMSDWYTDEQLTQIADFSESITQAMTFYAKAEPVTQNYRVSFDSKGGSAIEPYEAVKENSLIVAPIPPIRKGYTFAGWYKESTLVTAWNFNEDRVSENITLYAKWDKDDGKDPEDIDEGKPDKEKPTDESTEKEKTPSTGLSHGGYVYGISIILFSLLLFNLRIKEQES